MSATANTGQPGGPGHTGGRVFTMAGAPTVDNDASNGYHVGDVIVDTTNRRVYECVVETAAAAQWVELGRERNRHLTTTPITLLSSESGTHITNLGASGTITVNLPQNAPAGTRFLFTVMAAQALRIDPGAGGALYLASATQAYTKCNDDKYAWADAVGEQLELIADGNGDWVGRGDEGTWTIET